MIEIKWTDKKRFVPGVGIVEYGQRVIVSEDIANALVDQGQAEVFKKTQPKTKEKD